MSNISKIGVVNNTRTNDAIDAIIARLKPYRTKVFNTIDTLNFQELIRIQVEDKNHFIINWTANHKTETIDLGDHIFKFNNDLTFTHNIFNTNVIRIPPVQVPSHKIHTIKLNNENCIIENPSQHIIFNIKYNMGIKLRLSLVDPNNIQRYYLLNNTDYRIISKNRTILKIINKNICDIIIKNLNDNNIVIEYMCLLSDKLSLSFDNGNEWIPFTYDVNFESDKLVYGNSGYNKTVYRIKTNNSDMVKNNWLSTQFAPAYDFSYAYINAESLNGVMPFGYNQYGSTNIFEDGTETTYIDESAIADIKYLYQMSNSQLHNYMSNVFESNNDYKNIHNCAYQPDNANMSYKKFDENISNLGNGYKFLDETPDFAKIKTKFVESKIVLNHNKTSEQFKTFIGAQHNINNFKKINQYNYQLKQYKLPTGNIDIGINVLNESSLQNEIFIVNIINGSCIITSKTYNKEIARFDVSDNTGEPMITIGDISNNSISDYKLINSTFQTKTNITFNNTTYKKNAAICNANYGKLQTTIDVKEEIYKMNPYYIFKPSQTCKVDSSKAKIDINSKIITNLVVDKDLTVNDNVLIPYFDTLVPCIISEINGKTITKLIINIEKLEIFNISNLMIINNIKLKSCIGTSLPTNNLNVLMAYKYDEVSYLVNYEPIVNNDNKCMFVLDNISNGDVIFEIGGFVGNTKSKVKNTNEFEIIDLFTIYIASDKPKIIKEEFEIDFKYYFSYLDTSLLPTYGINYFSATEDVYSKNLSKITKIKQLVKEQNLDYDDLSFIRIPDNIPMDDIYNSFYLSYLGNDNFNVFTRNNTYGQFLAGIPYEAQVDNAPFSLLVKSTDNLKIGDQFVIPQITKCICDKNIEIKTGYVFNISPNLEYINENNVKYIILDVDTSNNTFNINYEDNYEFIHNIDNNLKIENIVDTEIGYFRIEKIRNSNAAQTNIKYSIITDFEDIYYSSYYKDINNVKLNFKYFSYDLPLHIKQNKNILPYHYDEDIYVDLLYNFETGIFDVKVKSDESNINFTYNNYLIGSDLIVTVTRNNIIYELFAISFDINTYNKNMNTSFIINTKSDLFSITSPQQINLVHAFSITQSERIGFLNRNGIIGTIQKNLELFNGGEYYTLELLPSTRHKIDINDQFYNYKVLANTGVIQVNQRNNSSIDICKSEISESVKIYYEDEPDDIVVI